MAYFQTKSGSLEESIRKAVGGIQEKVEYVEYKFKNRNDAMKAKKMLDAIQLMGFEINDDNISNGELSVDAGNRDMTKMHKDIMKKFRPKVMTQEKLVGGQKKLDKDKDGDLDAKDFAMLRKDAKKKKDESLDEGKMKQVKSLIGDIANAMKKDLTGLRKFIYNLDTDPLESIMDVISTNDSKAFMKMYPKSKKGEYMSSIAYAHRND